MGGMAYDGDTIRAARKRKGLSQEQLAERVGIVRGGQRGDPRTPSRWERNGIPANSPYLRALERALDLGEPDPEPCEVCGSPQFPPMPAPPTFEVTPLDLDDGPLFALKAEVDAEVRRRYFALLADRPAHAAGGFLPGTQLPFPHHLIDDADGGSRTQSGDQ